MKSTTDDVETAPTTSPHCDIVRVSQLQAANISKPPGEAWNSSPLPIEQCPSSYIGNFNSHCTLGGYRESDKNGLDFLDGLLSMICISCTPYFFPVRWKQGYSPGLSRVISAGSQLLPASCGVPGNFPHTPHCPILIQIGVMILNHHDPL